MAPNATIFLSSKSENIATISNLINSIRLHGWLLSPPIIILRLRHIRPRLTRIIQCSIRIDRNLSEFIGNRVKWRAFVLIQINDRQYGI